MDKPIYDDGGVSKWIGVPSLLIGIFVLWIAISIFCQYYLDLEFKFQMRGEAHHPLLAMGACLALGYWMSNVFFLRTRYYFDPERKELLVRHKSILGKSEKVVSLRQAKELYVRRGKIKASVFYDLGIRFLTGRNHLIARACNPEDLPIPAFASATGLFVHEWGSSDDGEMSAADTRDEQDVPPNA